MYGYERLLPNCPHSPPLLERLSSQGLRRDVLVVCFVQHLVAVFWSPVLRRSGRRVCRPMLLISSLQASSLRRVNRDQHYCRRSIHLWRGWSCYNASLILGVPSPVFVLEQKNNRFTFAGKVLSFFTSWTHGTILMVFARWRQPHKNGRLSHVVMRPSNSSCNCILLYLWWFYLTGQFVEVTRR